MPTDPAVNLVITAAFGLCNLLVGAVLGLGVSVITTYISHRFEEKRIAQERINRLDDEQRNKRHQIMQKRIDESEEYIRALTESCIMLFDYENRVITQVIKPNSDEGLQLLMKYDANFVDATRKQSSFLTISDDSLSKNIFDLTNSVIEEIGKIRQLDESIKNHTFSEEREQLRLNQFYSKVTTLKTNILKKLDELSAQERCSTKDLLMFFLFVLYSKQLL